MREDGKRRAERLIQQHLLGRIGDVVGAANDVCQRMSMSSATTLR